METVLWDLKDSSAPTQASNKPLSIEIYPASRALRVPVFGTRDKEPLAASIQLACGQYQNKVQLWWPVSTVVLHPFSVSRPTPSPTSNVLIGERRYVADPEAIPEWAEKGSSESKLPSLTCALET